VNYLAHKVTNRQTDTQADHNTGSTCHQCLVHMQQYLVHMPQYLVHMPQYLLCR